MNGAELHALVVDDSPPNLELAAYVLRGAGMTVSAVGDGQQALAQLQTCRPDVVLMDIQMPGIDGLSLTRQLKADAAMRDIVIIAFTAFAMKGDEARMRQAGCDGYLSKPIDVGRFAAQVREIVSRVRGGAGAA